MTLRLTATAQPLRPVAMRREARQLAALADAIQRALPEGESAFLADWRTRLARQAGRPDLESLDGEATLESLSLELRYLWLRHVHEQSAKLMMSPPHTAPKWLPDATRIHYPYDRWIKPDVLEERLDAEAPAPPGWARRSLVFASGMAALTTVLQHYRTGAARFFPPYRATLGVHWFGGYFEIASALDMLCDGRLRGRRHRKQDTLNAIVAQGLGDVILIEPVAADLHLGVFDLDAFAAAWRTRREARPSVILVDTSLVGDRFPIHRLCAELGPQRPHIVAAFRSGLKLDQQGLELANVGLLTLYAPADARFGENAALSLDDYADALRRARTVCGAGLSQDEYAALSAPFFLDPGARARHADPVFANNARFARALHAAIETGGGFLLDALHPSLNGNDGRPWAVSPFVNVRYAGGGTQSANAEDLRDAFRQALHDTTRRRGLTVRLGSSFGFRAHRLEMGFMPGHKYDTMRVAIGSRDGPSLDGVIRLFEELAAFETFEQALATLAAPPA